MPAALRVRFVPHVIGGVSAWESGIDPVCVCYPLATTVFTLEGRTL